MFRNRYRNWILFLTVGLLISIILPGVAVAARNSPKFSSNNLSQYVEGELLVRYKDGTTSKTKSNVLKKMQAQEIAREKSGIYRYKLPDGKSVQDALLEIENDTNVLYAEPNFRVTAYEVKNTENSVVSVVYDTYFNEQWGLAAIDVQGAWSAWETAGSPDNKVILAIIDQGIDLTHPDLVNRISTEYQYDFVDNDTCAATDDPVEESHGTHVAGIATAEMNDLGIVGVAGLANVKIMPVRVLDSEGYGTYWGVAQGIYWAADHGASIISMSLGGSEYSKALAEAVSYAQNKGMLVVAAAGNEYGKASGSYPAAYPGVLTVAAMQSDLKPAEFSNFGPEVEVAAPGVDILSTIPWESTGENGMKGYDSWAGTSMSTPFVSGLAALVKAVHPDYNAAQLAWVIESSVTVPDDWDNKYGCGVINAAMAVSADANTTPEIKFVSPQNNAVVYGKTSLQVMISDFTTVKKVSLYREDTLLGEVMVEENSFFCRFDYDFSDTDTGTYTLKAIAESSSGEQIGTSSIKVKVIKNATTGLVLKVIDPDGKPAVKANIKVTHVTPEVEGEYEQPFWGVTDTDGTIKIPGSVLPDGNEYLVEVNGIYEEEQTSEGVSNRLFYYRRLVTAPAAVEIALTTDTCAVTIKGTTDSEPLADAIIYGYVKNDNSYDPYSDFYTQLDSNGQLTIYVDKGSYLFHLWSQEHNCFLSQKLDIKENTQLFFSSNDGVEIRPNFYSGNADVSNAELAVLLSTSWDEENYNSEDPYFYYSFLVKNGDPIVVTPGKYSLANIIAVPKEESKWYYILDNDSVDISRSLNYHLGGTLSASINIDNEGQVFANETFFTEHNFTDSYGNRLWYAFSGDSDLLSKTTLMSREQVPQKDCKGKNYKLKFYTADQERQIFTEITDPVVQDAYPSVTPYYYSAEDFSWDPVIDETGNQVVWQGNFSTDDWYTDYLGGMYTLNPEKTPIDCKLVLSLDLDTPGAPWGGKVSDDTVVTAVYNDDVPYSITIVDPEGAPAENANVLIFKLNKDPDGNITGREMVFEDTTDEEGYCYSDHSNILETGQTYLLTANVYSYQDDNYNFIAHYIREFVAGQQALQWTIGKDETTYQYKVMAKEGDNNLSKAKVFAGPVSDGLILNEDYPYYSEEMCWGDIGTDGLSVWLDPGSYNIRLVDDTDDETGEYYLVKNGIKLGDLENRQIVFDASSAVPLTVSATQVNTADTDFSGSFALAQSGFTDLYDIFNADATPVMVSPGDYNYSVNIYRSSPEDEYVWWYTFDDSVKLTDEPVEKQYGGPLTLHILPGASSYKRGATVTAATYLADSYNHMVSGVHNEYLQFSGYSKSNYLQKGKITVKDVLPQNHSQLYPFFSIYYNNSDGSKTLLSRNKSKDYFKNASYSIPSDATLGTYTAELLLSAGPEGMARASADFTVSSVSSGGGGGGGSKSVSSDESLILTQKNISSAGGIVEADGGQVSLVFAPGTVQDDVQITVSRLTDMQSLTSEPSQSAISPVYEFNAGGKELKKPVTVRIKYNADLLKGTDPRLMGIYREDAPGVWVYKGGKLDRSTGTVKIELKSFSKYVVMSYNNTFKDTDKHWAEKKINFLAAKHVVNGFTPVEFKPDASVTRAQFVTMLAKAMKLNDLKSIDPGFNDVKTGDWYFDTVGAAVQAGLITGRDNANFDPNDPVTRQEASAMLVRAAGLQTKQDVSADFTDLPFQDKQQVDSWAREYVATAYSNGLINGISQEQFAPLETTTRAQAATLVVCILEGKGLAEVTTALEGTLQVSNIEGHHYELNSETSNYELSYNKANMLLKKQIEAKVGNKVTVEGYLQDGPTAKMRGPVLEVTSIK